MDDEDDWLRVSIHQDAAVNIARAIAPPSPFALMQQRMARQRHEKLERLREKRQDSR
jgi:hypothetical protein